MLLNHGMDALEVQDFEVFEQGTDLRAINLGDQPLSLALGKGIPEHYMMLPVELRFIHILAVIVRRVCVKEGFRPVIVGNQHLEALLLNDDISQPEGHLPDLIEQSTDVKGLAGKAPAGAGVAVADSLQVVRCPAHLRVVSPFMHGFFQSLRPFLLHTVVQDFLLRHDMDIRWTAKGLKPKPLVEFLTGIQGQHSQIQQELRGTVADDTEAVHQLPIHIVVHLKVHRIVAKKYGTTSAKDFDKTLVFLWEYGVKDRQQCGFVADAGDRGSDRLFHAPFIMETAGTVPVVRIPYRPLGFVPAIFTTEMERRLSLNAHLVFKCITSFTMC